MAAAGRTAGPCLEELLKVVAVEVGSAEDEALRHLQLLHHAEQHQWFQHFGALGKRLGRAEVGGHRVALVNPVSGHLHTREAGPVESGQ